MVPLTLLLIALLLWLHFRDLTEVLIVLLSIPFALVGSVWLLWALDYRISTAVWVGLIALIGLAAQTGIVMIVYIDNAYARRKAAGQDPRPLRHHPGPHGGDGAAGAPQAHDGGDHAGRPDAAPLGHRLGRRRHEAHRRAHGGRPAHQRLPDAGDHPGGLHLLAPRAAPLGAAGGARRGRCWGGCRCGRWRIKAGLRRCSRRCAASTFYLEDLPAWAFWLAAAAALAAALGASAAYLALRPAAMRQVWPGGATARAA